MGVRIFPDSREFSQEPLKGGRVGDSLAAARRMARGMRRNRDRGKNRMAYMMARLVEMGLMPQDSGERKALENLNPYQLRAEGMERPLTPHELGRALFHLGLRRGFKSNRKEFTKEKKEGGKRAEHIKGLKQALGNKTLGQFLWDRLQAGKPIRFRDNMEWFPDRAMYAEEFDALRDCQAPHHSLSEDDWLSLRNDSILFQHPLRPVPKSERRRCAFKPKEICAHRDTPIAQWFRIYSELGNLRWIDREQTDHRLNPEQRQAILDKLLSKKTGITWNAIRKLKGADGQLLFSRDCRFNLEDDRREKLDAHKVAIWMTNEPELAPLWGDMDPATLDDVFIDLHAAQEDEQLIAGLVGKYGLTPEQAKAFAALPLGSKTQNLSRQVMEELVPILRDQGIEYYDAVKQLTDGDGNPLHHSIIVNSERMEKLPYYGQVLYQSMVRYDSRKDAKTDPEGHFGKIGNPTVHVALNQLRRVVNALIGRFGCAPSEIHVELSRDLKLGAKQRSEINREIAKNTRRNDKLREEWERLSGGRAATARDLKKLKLWEELGKDELARRCVFTGKVIAAHHLINGEVEIEHLLPRHSTQDDTMANLTLAFKGANRAKGKNSPYEAFADGRHRDFNWQEILDRVSRLSKAKRWRFGEDAMDKWLDDNTFIARQLTDNQYIARAAQGYLRALTPKVVPVPGRLTAMVRGKWHLSLSGDGKKDRKDHRHHAI
ncbi:MAG: type II CRISPR RNA-guided endonuclease Cas9, partial [Proteobacteria bacterium]|nr:type II CRISPR RNA-guided endonuclease Cas9 [Pseudomonadota bacterium]